MGHKRKSVDPIIYDMLSAACLSLGGKDVPIYEQKLHIACNAVHGVYMRGARCYPKAPSQGIVRAILFSAGQLASGPRPAHREEIIKYLGALGQIIAPPAQKIQRFGGKYQPLKPRADIDG